MFGHYLPNKNEGATVAPNSKFRELNKGWASSVEVYFPIVVPATVEAPFSVTVLSSAVTQSGSIFRWALHNDQTETNHRQLQNEL